MFDGLDTFATVLDGEPIADPQHVDPLRVDVTDRLEPGRAQDLRVRFTMPEQAVADRLVGLERGDVDWLFSPPERIFSQGADELRLGHRAPHRPCGLWRPVRLGGFHEGAIRDRTSVASSCPTVGPGYPWKSGGGARDGGRVAGRGNARCGDSAVAWEMTLEERDGRLVGRADAIVEAQLWWPAGEGEQNLYRAGWPCRRWPCCAHRHGAVWHPRVRLLQTTRPAITRFHCAVNDRRTFIRDELDPHDALFPRVTRERLAQVLDLAGELNCNMLRIWGGGSTSPRLLALRRARPAHLAGLHVRVRSLSQDDASRRGSSRGGGVCAASATTPAWPSGRATTRSLGLWWTGDASRAAGNRISHAVLPEVVAQLDPDLPAIIEP